MGKTLKLIYLFVSTVFILVLLNLYYSHQFKMGAFFNTDSLNIPDMVRDILQSSSSLFNWSFSRAPSFPDILIFYILNSFVSSYHSIALFFSIQILITFILISKFYKEKFSSSSVLLLTSLSMTGLLYLLILQVNPLFIIMKNGHHYSEFLVWLITTYLFINYIVKPNKKYFVFILCISFFQCVSDQLFYLHFIIPALILLLGNIVLKKRSINSSLKFLSIGLLIVSVLAYICSYMISDHLTINITQDITLESIQSDLARLGGLFVKLNKQVTIYVITIALYYIICIIKVFKEKENIFSSYYFFILISFAVTFFVILLSPSKNLIGRYLLPYLYTPIFFICFFIPNELIDKLKKFHASILVIVIGAFLSTTTISAWKNEYYPKSVMCVDDELLRRGIKNVIAGFWDARYYSFLSKNKLNVVPYYLNFKEDHRVTNRKRFVDSYSVVLVDSFHNKGFNRNDVVDFLGEPIDTISCAEISILLYNENSLRINSQKKLFNTNQGD